MPTNTLKIIQDVVVVGILVAMSICYYNMHVQTSQKEEMISRQKESLWRLEDVEMTATTNIYRNMAKYGL